MTTADKLQRSLPWMWGWLLIGFLGTTALWGSAGLLLGYAAISPEGPLSYAAAAIGLLCAFDGMVFFLAASFCAGEEARFEGL